ncbi:MAG: protein translocase subunit SecD [Phycisphaeraceae bacterium]|nr:protein translocase subunit SecD [Phycisphaeraceae bacterium]
MSHLGQKIFLILVVMVVCILAIIPPAKKLRKGRDLAGGVSLVYALESLTDKPVTSEVVERTIEALKERVDPNGLYEIAFTPMGSDRIEIAMPLPNDEVKGLKQAYEDALSALGQLSIDESEFERAMRADPREPALVALAVGDPDRLSKLGAAADLYDDAKAAREAYENAPEGASDEEKLALINAAGAAVEAYQNARAEALKLSVDPNEVAKALELPNKDRILRDKEKDQTVDLGNPRALALEAIKERSPKASDRIDAVVAAYEAFEAKRRGLDDPADLMRLLRGAGVLDFRIAVEPQDPIDAQRYLDDLREKGPLAASDDQARWFEVHNIESMYQDVQGMRFVQQDPRGFFAQRDLIGAERDGSYYVLLYDTPGERMLGAEGDWSMAGAFPTQDERGLPAIGFKMDAGGARKLGRLTEAHKNKPMAILLDNRMYTAPNLLARISTNGIIQGQFTQAEIQYILKTLNAGSLQAKLSPEPISQQTLAPSLGADNLSQGFLASVTALIVVAAFMMLYYFGSGVIAVIALLCSAIMILGAMSLARAAFTLPGIAGIVLTFGMAVDANVLIYERIREEIGAGEDLKTAVRLGYQKVLSSIVDANVTNLIVCFVLGYTATQEIKGFAITLGIGIIATLISSLLITRIIFALLIDYGKIKSLPQLPMVAPVVQRMLSPNVDWLKMRFLFFPLSALLLSVGLFMVFTQGNQMLDTEFRAGTAATFDLAQGHTMTRQDVEGIIHGIGEGKGPNDPLSPMLNADVIVVDPEADGVTSDRFQVKTVITDQRLVSDAIIEAMGDRLDLQPALHFVGANSTTLRDAPFYRVLDDNIGAVIGRPEALDNVADYRGGVAFLLDDITPPQPLENLTKRLQAMREAPGNSDALRRSFEVIPIDGTAGSVRTACVVARDPDLSVVDSPERWLAEVATPEWGIIRDALTETSSLAGVQSFDPAMARTFKAKAIVAVILSFLGIMIYIWVRFGSLRYSLAAIIALMHDVIAVLGLIAMSEVLYHYAPGFTAAIGLEPFKIDLGLVAALMTIIGYSLNDTIIILDRVRENRGKLAYASAKVINNSINQTISRTIITSGTTLFAVLILYIDGGQAIRSFSYSLLCGVIVGTYSSIAVAAPLVYSKKTPTKGGSHELATGREAEREGARELAPT